MGLNKRFSIRYYYCVHVRRCNILKMFKVNFLTFEYVVQNLENSKGIKINRHITSITVMCAHVVAQCKRCRTVQIPPWPRHSEKISGALFKLFYSRSLPPARFVRRVGLIEEPGYKLHSSFPSLTPSPTLLIHPSRRRTCHVLFLSFYSEKCFSTFFFSFLFS